MIAIKTVATPDSADLVIVGAGLAGLVAACRSAELGLRVILIESGSAARHRCNTRFSGGVFHVAFTPANAGADAVMAAIEQASAGYADPALMNAMAQDASRAISWLAEHGADFGQGGEPAWMNRMLQPFSLREAGFANHWPGKGADLLLERLETLFAQHGGTMLRGLRGRDLIRSNGVCQGLRATTSDGGYVELRAPAIIIADGGFQGNADLVRRYITADPAALCVRGAGTGMGDGLAMAEAAGARIVGTDKFYGHVQCAEARDDDRLWPYPILDLVASSAVVVDRNGRRFVDEGLGGVPITNAIAALPDPGNAYVILDAAIWDSVGRAFLLPPNPTLEDRGVTIRRASTLAMLADAIGMDPTLLEATIAAHNTALASGTEAQLAPPRSRSNATLAALPCPVATAPFMAIRLSAGITYTMGGIAIDGDGHALDTQGRRIVGLYAAGAATGGLEGGPRSTYVGGLMKALVFGLRSAEAVANDRHSITAAALL